MRMGVRLWWTQQNDESGTCRFGSGSNGMRPERAVLHYGSPRAKCASTANGVERPVTTVGFVLTEYAPHKNEPTMTVMMTTSRAIFKSFCNVHVLFSRPDPWTETPVFVQENSHRGPVSGMHIAE